MNLIKPNVINRMPFLSEATAFEGVNILPFL